MSTATKEPPFIGLALTQRLDTALRKLALHDIGEIREQYDAGNERAGVVRRTSELEAVWPLALAAERYPLHEGAAVTVHCCKCGGPVEATANHAYVFGGVICCDPCVEKKVRKDAWDVSKAWWSRNCPVAYQDTTEKDSRFNHAAWKRMLPHTLETSLVLIGETGTGKTRLACYWLRRALAEWTRKEIGKSIRFAFPEDLKSFPIGVTRRDYLHTLAAPDILLMDDAFLAGASKESVSDFLKDLIDMRMRAKKATIITTQVDGAEYKKDADKFRNMSNVDAKRVDAIVRRVKENFVVIDTDKGEEENALPDTLF